MDDPKRLTDKSKNQKLFFFLLESSLGRFPLCVTVLLDVALDEFLDFERVDVAIFAVAYLKK